MTHDVFEDELRTLLRGATEARSADLGEVDTGAALAVGRRVVRRRRAALVGASAAVLLVVGAGTWTALDQGRDRAAPVPATRTTMPAIGLVATDVIIGEGPETTRFTVRLDTATGGASATTADLDSGPPVDLGSVPRVGEASSWASFSAQPMTFVGVVPSAATTILPRFTKDAGGVTAATSPLPGTGYQAIVWRTEKPVPGTELSSLLWSDGTRAVDGAGAVVPSTTVDGNLVYVDDVADEMGFVGRDGASTIPMAEFRAAGLPPIHIQGKEADGRLEVTYLAVLPAGATAVEAVLDTRVRPVDPVRTFPVPGAGTLALLTWNGATDVTGHGVTQLRWHDSGGDHLLSDAGSVDLPSASGTRGSAWVYGLTEDGDTTIRIPTSSVGGQAQPPIELREVGDSPDGFAGECLPRFACAVLPRRADHAELRDTTGTPYFDERTIQVALPGTDVTLLLATSTRGWSGVGTGPRDLVWADSDGYSHVVELERPAG